jgi:hypothetical protein
MAGGKNDNAADAIVAKKARLAELERHAQLEREELEAAEREAAEWAVEEARLQEVAAAQERARQCYVRGCRDRADVEIMSRRSASPVASRSGDSVSSSRCVIKE